MAVRGVVPVVAIGQVFPACTYRRLEGPLLLYVVHNEYTSCFVCFFTVGVINVGRLRGAERGGSRHMAIRGRGGATHGYSGEGEG